MHSFLKKLIGSWESIEAKGKYPTIKDFVYNEKLTFEEYGQPLIAFRSNTQINQATKHCETGFIRANPDTNKAFSNEAHNFGLSVVLEGSISENKMILESKSIGRLSISKEPHVTGILKTYELINDDELRITIDMATSQTEITNHLQITYKRMSN